MMIIVRIVRRMIGTGNEENDYCEEKNRVGKDHFCRRMKGKTHDPVTILI